MTTGPADAMNPTTELKFRWTWHPYQTRVLDRMQDSLRDGRLHVVAAPGSGKTSLGIEAFRRLGSPCVVFAPTKTIRDQWIARVSDFTPEGKRPGWVGVDLDAPDFLTVVTYQALHQRYRASQSDDGEEEDDGGAAHPPTAGELETTAKRLRDEGVRTVIFDEAHHLRQEWWKALRSLVEQLDGARVIALTGTPPYDVAGTEWRRYQELCGPIDEHIGIPELVRIGTLCPHQDYVWAVLPSPDDVTTVRRHDAAVDATCKGLLADPAWQAAVAHHPFVSEQGIDVDRVLDRPELAVALLVFLKATEQPLPPALLRSMSCSASAVPALDLRWWEVLIGAYLDEPWPGVDEAHRTALTRRLHAEGLLERGELRIRFSQAVRVALASSATKIAACEDIGRVERKFRGDDLRQVVLTDFIHEQDPRRLGAWSVFASLVGIDPVEAPHVALLTGRMTIVHASLRGEFASRGDREAEGLPGFVEVADPEAVAIATRLLETGRLRTVVGTRALLGEGWDAPSVNSVVIASGVGSYMLSNQMRGRALRNDTSRPGKQASIWHLVAIDPSSRSGSTDLEQLRRRFDAFVGLAEGAPRLEAGLDRLNLPPLSREEDVEPFDREFMRRLFASDGLAARWREAVGDESDGRRVLPAVVSDRRPELRSFVFWRTLRALLYSTALGALATLANVLVRGFWMNPRILTVGAVVALASSLPNLIRALRLAAKHAPVDGSVKAIAETVLEALCDAGVIGTDRRTLEVSAPQIEPGAFSIALAGGTYPEAATFAESVEETLGPVDNPRYLVTRRGRGLFSSRLDFHAVPSRLAVKKELAEAFAKSWRSHVGPTKLIYTRTPRGRRALLAARARALSTEYVEPAKRRDRWQ